MELKYFHFNIPNNYKRAWSFLEEKSYGLALDNLVFTCVDVVVISETTRKVLLGKRTYHPAKNTFWFTGGKQNSGETINDTAKRNTNREIGLNINNLNRFILLGVCQLAFIMRRQKSVDKGSHATLFIVCLFISDNEVNKLNPNNEYSTVNWFSVEDIINGDFHLDVKRIVMGVKNKLLVEQ